MSFQFENLSAFLEMAGHGPYVWAAYGVSAVVLIWLLLRPISQKREVLRQIARELKRKENIPES